MSAPAAGYQPMHLGIHELILTGHQDDTSAWEPSGGLDGVMGLVVDLQALATTPYAAITVYDAFAAGQPLELLFSDMTDLLADFVALAPEVEYDDFVTAATATIDSIFTGADVDNAVTAFETKQNIAAVAQIGILNLLASDLEATNSSMRVNGIIGLLESVNQDAAKYRADLELKLYGDKFAATVKAADDIMRTRLQNQAHIIQIAGMRMASAQLHVEAKRLYQNDILQNELGDILWDIKANEFAYQALGSLGGISTIPAQANPFSTFASSVAALTPLIVQAYKAFN